MMHSQKNIKLCEVIFMSVCYVTMWQVGTEQLQGCG